MLASDGARCREDAFDVRFPLLSAATLAALLGAGASAQAQALLPLSGFAPLPSFAWDQPSLSPRWEGSYARISSGFQVTSGKHMRTSAGPTIGLEAGTMRRELFSGTRVTGAVRPSFGELVLINADGGLDAWMGYGISGAKVVCESATKMRPTQLATPQFT